MLCPLPRTPPFYFVLFHFIQLKSYPTFPLSHSLPIKSVMCDEEWIRLISECLWLDALSVSPQGRLAIDYQGPPCIPHHLLACLQNVRSEFDKRNSGEKSCVTCKKCSRSCRHTATGLIHHMIWSQNQLVNNGWRWLQNAIRSCFLLLVLWMI